MRQLNIIQDLVAEVVKIAGTLEADSMDKAVVKAASVLGKVKNRL